MTKRYNQQQFVATINGRTIVFNAYTTSTRCGFCHTITCPSLDITDTKASYYNRTWERFDYESCLGRAIDKCPKDLREGLRWELIDKRAKEESERAERMANAFKSLHSRLSEENKERLAKSDITIESEGDAKAVMGLMAVMAMTE